MYLIGEFTPTCQVYRRSCENVRHARMFAVYFSMNRLYTASPPLHTPVGSPNIKWYSPTDTPSNTPVGSVPQPQQAVRANEALDAAVSDKLVTTEENVNAYIMQISFTCQSVVWYCIFYHIHVRSLRTDVRFLKLNGEFLLVVQPLLF